MKRSTAWAVGATALILIVAGNAPRLPWDDAARLLRTRVLASAPAWPVRARHAATAAPRAAAPRIVMPRIVMPHLTRPALRLPVMHAPQLVLPRLPLAAVPYAVAAAAACAIGAGVVLAYGSLRRRRRRIARARTHRLAREGRSTAGISRSLRLPKDAVRTLLADPLASPRSR